MIKVKDLEFTYPGADKSTINRISFETQRGEIFGFLGPSGAGKSTVQKILFRLLQNYSGDAAIDGKELKSWDQSLYEKIGVGFELPNHYLKLSARENLEFFGGFYKSKSNPMEMLKLVGLEKDADKKVSDFSKGMKMRLNFIRSFIHNPDILFLDEPTSGLDPVNAKVVKDLIMRLKSEGKTIFITTHQMHDADELCDQVAFLVDGKIMAMDQPENLKLQHSQRTLQVAFEGEPAKQTFELATLGRNTEFLTALNTKTIKTMHSQEVTLDDIFIKVTGKTLS